MQHYGEGGCADVLLHTQEHEVVVVSWFFCSSFFVISMLHQGLVTTATQQATFFPWNRNAAAAAPDLRFDPWCPQGQAVTNNVAWFSSSNLPAGIILNSSTNYYCGCTSVQDRYALEFMTFAKTDFLRRHSMQLIDRNKLLLFAFSLVTPKS